MLQFESWLKAYFPLAKMRGQQEELVDLQVGINDLDGGDTEASYLT